QRAGSPRRLRPMADKIDIFHQSKNLETATEHFGMKQRLQRAFRFLSRNDFRRFRNNAGQKMMLVGEAGDAQPIFLSTLLDVCPINVRRDVRLADLLERQVEKPVLRTNLK